MWSRRLSQTGESICLASAHANRLGVYTHTGISRVSQGAMKGSALGHLVCPVCNAAYVSFAARAQISFGCPESPTCAGANENERKQENVAPGVLSAVQAHEYSGANSHIARCIVPNEQQSWRKG